MLKRWCGGLGLGDGTPWGFKTTGESPMGYFACSEGMGEDSVLNQGIHCTGGFLEAAQVELVNYKMPHMRSVI